MINNIKAFGKFLDQPILISKFNKTMPSLLVAGSSLYLIKQHKDEFKKAKTFEEKKEINKNTFKKSIVLFGSILSALFAPKIASKITKRSELESLKDIIQKNKKLIDGFLKKNKVSDDFKILLNKAKENILTFDEIKTLQERFKSKNGKELFENLIPDPKDIKAKDIFSEIGYLSIYGAIPVIGGIASGVAVDKIQKENVKEKLPDKINEGIYQYLANIFMCNIGAGGALAILEKLNIKSKSQRAIGMITGIILTGVVGGSKIANLIANKIINPKLYKNKETKDRTPELLDIGMHADDIATVSLLSGLKWIEPALPTLYSISGYKAGMGYRN